MGASLVGCSPLSISVWFGGDIRLASGNFWGGFLGRFWVLLLVQFGVQFGGDLGCFLGVALGADFCHFATLLSGGDAIFCSFFEIYSDSK